MAATDLVPFIPEVPPGLREAAQIGTLIPFVGAGVSRLAGCPSWAKFADGALQGFVDQGKFSYSQLDQVTHLNPRVKLSLARALEEEHRLQIDFRRLLHPCDRSEHIQGRKLYATLFRLGRIFVTTNYDEWLDEEVLESTLPLTAGRSTAEALPRHRITVVHKVRDFTPAVLSQPYTVIHLHGSLHNPAEMILTTQDYVKHYANDRFTGEAGKENRVLTFLEHLFKHKSVLFIGYGLEELEILEYVILKARRPSSTEQAEARHYILQGFFSHQHELLSSLKSYYLRQCGIQLIPFSLDRKGWGQLLDVLDEFARLIPVSEPYVLQRATEMEDLLNG